MNNKFKTKDIISIVLVILIVFILCASSFIKNNYFLNVASITVSMLILLVINILNPLLENLRNHTRKFINFLGPILNLIFIVSTVLYIVVNNHYLFITIAIIVCIFDFMVKFIILKDKNDLFLFGVMMLYLYTLLMNR